MPECLNAYEPGIYRLTEEQYHGDPCPKPSLSASIAVTLLTDCPLVAKLSHPRLTPQPEREEKDAFDLGSAAHEMLLESSDERIVVCEFDDWRTKAAREARAAARAAGKYPLLTKHAEAVRAMAAAARDFISHSELAGIFENGSPEQTVIWREGEIYCRAKTDWLSVDKHRTIILDYKTTSMSMQAWVSGIGREHRDVQATLYPRGLRALGYHKPEFIWLVQQTFTPYCCFLVGMSAERKEIGEWKCQRAIATWAACLSSDEWPAYGDRIVYPIPETWESKQFTEALAQEGGETL